MDLPGYEGILMNQCKSELSEHAASCQKHMSASSSFPVLSWQSEPMQFLRDNG